MNTEHVLGIGYKLMKILTTMQWNRSPTGRKITGLAQQVTYQEGHDSTGNSLAFEHVSFIHTTRAEGRVLAPIARSILGSKSAA